MNLFLLAITGVIVLVLILNFIVCYRIGCMKMCCCCLIQTKSDHHKAERKHSHKQNNNGTASSGAGAGGSDNSLSEEEIENDKKIHSPHSVKINVSKVEEAKEPIDYVVQAFEEEERAEAENKKKVN